VRKTGLSQWRAWTGSILFASGPNLEITIKTLILAAIRCSLIFTAVAALSIVYPTSVQAVPAFYQYTGNPYTEVVGDYTTSMYVTVTLALPQPLHANMPLNEVFPTRFYILDGVQAITAFDAGLQSTFQFATDAAGHITQWFVLASSDSAGRGHEVSTFSLTVEGASDRGVTNSFTNFGRNFSSPGNWSGFVAVPDAGSTLSLMTLTLMALGLVARRFQPAAG